MYHGDQITSGPRDPEDEESQRAVNSLILDYYKKFGRKRDLEQYFSLSTAQSDIRDPSSLFWSRMKTEAESSDSGEKSDKKSESSQELCRISIRLPAPDPCSSQEEDSKAKTESVSPPIIIEEISPESRQNSDDEATKSDDNNSQKSYDIHLDTSMNKPHSPSSSITSQRKLEWDSLADVGYANESDRKTSASTLSTLERLALKQQYSNNDTQQSNLGVPTAHSTPLDENDSKSKGKKGLGKKSTKIYKKDVDFLEVNVPHSSHINPPQSINVNLTKHISFNVEKDGKVNVDNIQKDVNVSPEKAYSETKVSPRVRMDKEIQTFLPKPNETNNSEVQVEPQLQRIPILISLNTLRSRIRRKKLRIARRKIKSKKRLDKEMAPVQEKSGEQLSDAESFEYMPGHIYNQNQITANERSANSADNKSSLESSGVLTTDSSKGSKHSFVKDLEKSIDLLKAALQQHGDDSNLRKQLIKQVCQRLLKSKYRDDDSTTDFLSGLSFRSKKLGLGPKSNTTTSTSDVNNSAESSIRPKKSILRSDKFNPEPIASTSQSVPNLPVASYSEKRITSELSKNLTTFGNTDSDISSKKESSSDNVFAKTSSEELYQKYLQAKKKEETYKKHLRDKEMFLKQKLVSSDNAFKVPVRVEVKRNSGSSNRLKDLIHDLTRNNYDDGSGDASKLEGGPGSSRDLDRFLPNRNQRSHSVFTLSSGTSDSKKPNLKKRLQCDIKDLSQPGPSKGSHYCCCTHHSQNLKVGGPDSVQVNINKPCGALSCPMQSNKPICSAQEQQVEAPKHTARVISDDLTGDIKYVCLCSNKVVQEVPDSFLIYKCSRLTNKGTQLEDTTSKVSNAVFAPCNNQTCVNKNLENAQSNSINLNNKSSQANMLINMLTGEKSLSHSNDKKCTQKGLDIVNTAHVTSSQKVNLLNEATRCIQTEISINPKISEPTLSDINIVSDTDCAKLVSEQHRELKTPSLSEVFKGCQGKDNTESANDPVSSYKSSGTSKDVDIELEDDNFGEICKGRTETNYNQQTNIDHSEKFTIPIQGTNMTLMVTIGSERKVAMTEKPKEMFTQGIGTDKISVLEQATCLSEECTKGIQSFNVTCNSETIDPNSNSACNELQNESKKPETMKEPLLISTCLYTQEPKYGTFPKNSPTSERKPFKRSNTDTDRVTNFKVSAFSTLNTETSENTCMEIQAGKSCSCGCNGPKENCKKNCKGRTDKLKYDKINIDTHSCDGKNIPNKNSKMCFCGCGGLIEDCKANCRELKSLVNRLEEKPLRIEKYTQVDDLMSKRDVADPNSEKCACGCGGMKDNCKDCKEPDITPRRQGVKQLDKQISTEHYFSDDQSTDCTCGCGGKKDKCKKNCIEQNSSLKQHCSKKLNSTHELVSQEKSQACPCGCGGTKDNCKGNCKINVLPKGLRKNQATCKQISPDEDFSGKPSQECTCGCKGTKDKCKKNCKEKLKTSPRRLLRTQLNKQISTENDFTDKLTQDCPCGCGSLKRECKGDCKEHTVASKCLERQESSNRKEVGTQKDPIYKELPKTLGVFRKTEESTHLTSNDPSNDARCLDNRLKTLKSHGEQTNVSLGKSNKSNSDSEQTEIDPILEMIQNITKKYSKKEIEKSKRKKCFREIMTVLNYLLETDDSTDYNEKRKHLCESTSTADETDSNIKKVGDNSCSDSNKKLPEKRSCDISKKLVDKGVQLFSKKSKSRTCVTESSEMPTSTDIPGTSSDSATCKVLNKIKKECERYHQKRCKIHSGKKSDCTSSTSANCDQCRRVHHCSCRNHKCKGHKKCDKIQKNPVAYNLILQTSESIVSEEPVRDRNCQLKNVIVKVPKKKPESCVPFKEMAAKFERNMNCAMPCTMTKDTRSCRSRSLPNESEISSMEEIIRRSQGATVREYLEKNRPDFIEKCSQRQSCLKYISESRANDRAVQRELLSLHVAQMPDVTDLDKDELRRLAKDLGKHMRQRRPAPKFISEREMKKHSEQIYKSLPEVVQKKEDIKKENIKKTNLLMANIFKKNLQKKTLRGSVNLSNYSQVIKI